MVFYLLEYSARGGTSDQGCQIGYKSGLPSVAFFYFIYIELNVIGTCMQIFKKIDRKKTNFFQLKIWRNVSVPDFTILQ